MKKLLVLVLAVVLTLSLAVVASAATFSPYVGGEFQLNYSPDFYGDDTPLASEYNDANGARVKGYVTGTVEDKDTNTWAKIGYKFTSWNYSGIVADSTGKTGTHWDEVYEAGVKGIGGLLDIWYTNDECNDADRGQVPLVQNWYKFGGDPVFDKGPNHSISFHANNEAVDAALIYTLNKTEKNQIDIAGTYKFDGGNVWVAYEAQDKTTNDTQTAAGVVYKLGFGTIKVDYSVWSADKVDDTSTIQANLDFNGKFDVTVLYDNKHFLANDGGIGFGANWNITDKLYIGGRSLTTSDAVDKTSNNNQTVAYLGVKYGVFDTRIGAASVADGDNNFFVMTHVGMW